MSASLLAAAREAQWSPLLLAAGLLAPTWPLLGAIFATKPNLGAALLAWLPGRAAVRALAWSIAFALLALAVLPRWPIEWLSAIGENLYTAPVARPWGWLLLLAVLRWRRPEARLLLVLAIVPHSTTLMDPLLLFGVAASLAEASILALLTYLQPVIVARHAPFSSWAAFSASSGEAAILALYLPVLLMLLRRPNAGDLPEWVERRVASLPVRLRGAPAAERSSGE